MSSIVLVPLRIHRCSSHELYFAGCNSPAFSFVWSLPHFHNIRMAVLTSYTGVLGRVSALIFVFIPRPWYPQFLYIS